MKAKWFLIPALLASALSLSARTYHDTVEVIVPEGLDKTPEVVEMVLPQFPAYLRDQRIYSGTAQVVLMVDKEGNPSDFVVLVASHPDVAEAMVSAMKQWKFEPPTVNGKPTAIRMLRTEGLAIDQSVPRITAMEAFSNQKDNPKKNFYRLPEPKELDVPLKPKTIVPPEYPVGMLGPDDPKEGRVVIDCFISPEGDVLAPTVESAPHPAFGAAAYSAVRQWKFEPLTKDGKPAYTRARIPIEFSAPDQSES